MVSFDNAKVISSTFIKFEDQGIRIERLQGDSKQQKIRLSSSIGDKNISFSLILSEEELLGLLNQAIHDGVLPRDFIGKLRDRIEI